MKMLSEPNTVFFSTLIKGLGCGDYNKYQFSDLMILSVEFIGRCITMYGDAAIYSISQTSFPDHIICNPEMGFLLMKETGFNDFSNRIYPYRYHHYLSRIFYTAAEFTKEGTMLINPILQAQCAELADYWMQNVRWQIIHPDSFSIYKNK